MSEAWCHWMVHKRFCCLTVSCVSLIMTLGGFLDMVMDNTLSQKMVSALLKSNYVRVNSFLLPAGCNEEMDDR